MQKINWNSDFFSGGGYSGGHGGGYSGGHGGGYSGGHGGSTAVVKVIKVKSHHYN